MCTGRVQESDVNPKSPGHSEVELPNPECSEIGTQLHNVVTREHNILVYFCSINSRCEHNCSLISHFSGDNVNTQHFPTQKLIFRIGANFRHAPARALWRIIPKCTTPSTIICQHALLRQQNSTRMHQDFWWRWSTQAADPFPSMCINCVWLCSVLLSCWQMQQFQ